MGIARSAINRMAQQRSRVVCSIVHHRLFALSTLLTCFLAGACNDAVAPTVRPIPIAAPLRNVQPLPQSQAILPYTPLGNVPLATYDFVEGVLVEGRIEGFVGVTSNVGATAVHVNDGVDYKGVYDFSMSGQCDWAATISSPLLSSPNLQNCRPAEPRYTKTEVWKDTLVLGGVGGNGVITARRGGGSGDPLYCPDGSLCHVISGMQTVTLTPLPAEIRLTANRPEISPKTILIPDPYTLPVSLTVSSTPATYHGITVPRKVLSGKWVPASGGYGNSTVSCPQVPASSNSITCSGYIYERGSAVVTARVNGVVQTDTIRVEGPEVRIVPDLAQMKFSVEQYKGTALIKKVDAIQRVLVSVVDAANNPIRDQIVTLTLAAHDGTGGHLHSGSKPTGKLDSTRVNTGPTGIRPVYYTAPRVSGPVTINGTSGAVRGNHDIQVGIFTLDSLPDGNYDKTGAKAGQHVENHYATPNHIQKLIAFAAWFNDWYGAHAQFNDSALPLGGLYDYKSTWQQPHAAHGEGTATDFYTGNLEPIAIWIAADKWEHMTGVAPGDETIEARHLHIMTKN
jgi:hypothetical protein